MASVIDAVTDNLQARLSDSNGPWARRLADLLVKNAMGATLEKLVPLDEAVDMVRNGLHDYVRSEAALRTFIQDLRRQFQLLARMDGPLEDALPAPLVHALKQWARRPWSPGRDSLLTALDHEPVRAMLSRMLAHAMLDFVTAGATKKSHKGLGGILGALGHDVGTKLEDRAETFARFAVAGVMHHIVHELTDPSRRKEQSEVREAILTGVLSIDAKDVLDELEELDLPAVAKLFRKAVGDWLESEKGARGFNRWMKDLLAPHWRRKLKDVVRDNGLERVANEHLPRIVEQRVIAFAEAEEFRVFIREISEEP